MTEPTQTRRRRLYFSIRGIGLVTILIAVGFACVVHQRNLSQKERLFARKTARHYCAFVLWGPFDSWELEMEHKPQGMLRDLTRFVLGERIRSFFASGSKRLNELPPFVGFKNLEVLQLSCPPIAEIGPLAGLTNLKLLYLDSTSVTDLSPLAGLTKLKVLYLDSTSVADLTPLAGLTNLTYLFLGSTAVSDISTLAELKNLKALGLNSTAVTDLTPLARLRNLERLNLESTDVTEEQIQLLQQALPNCNIRR